jgi:hypothetical protein
MFSSQQLCMVKEIKKLVQKEQNPYFTWGQPLPNFIFMHPLTHPLLLIGAKFVSV